MKTISKKPAQAAPVKFYDGNLAKPGSEVVNRPGFCVESTFQVVQVMEHCIVELGSELTFDQAQTLFDQNPRSAIIFSGYRTVKSREPEKIDLWQYPISTRPNYFQRGERIFRFLIWAPLILLGVLGVLGWLGGGL